MKIPQVVVLKERGALYGASPIVCPEDIIKLMAKELEGLAGEEFYAINLDFHNKPINYVSFAGADNHCVIDKKAILRAVLLSGASKLMLFHNHPSGDVEPSANDISMTRKIKEVTELLDIDLLDHVIIGDGTYYSFNKEGLL